MTVNTEHLLSIAEAFSEEEIYDMVRGAISYVETLLEEKITIPFEDIVAELWVDKTLLHTPKMDVRRLKQNQRSYAMRGLIWRLRDYITEQRFSDMPVTGIEGCSIRKMPENQQAQLEVLSESERCEPDEQADFQKDMLEMLETAKLHSLVQRRNPTLWKLMVAAGLAEDQALAVNSITDVRALVEAELKASTLESTGRKRGPLTKEEFVQHLKLETRSFCRTADLDFDETWIKVAQVLSKIRGSRGSYRKKAA